MPSLNYPSPCGKCEKKCTSIGHCHDYKAFINAWWKHFNACYRVLCCYDHTANTEKFAYEHPDVYRRYIERGPCPDCAAKENCQTVCATYWKWWDARMAWFRRRLRA